MTYVKAGNEDTLRQLILLRELIEYNWLGLTEDEVLLRLSSYIESQASQSIVLKKILQITPFILSHIDFISLMAGF